MTLYKHPDISDLHKKKKYLLAIKLETGNEILEFETKKERDDKVELLKKNKYSYSTSEIE